MSKVVSQLIYSRIGEETDVLRGIRFKDEITGQEHLAEPSEVTDPSSIDVGDDEAYRVSLFEIDPAESKLAATYNVLQR